MEDKLRSILDDRIDKAGKDIRKALLEWGLAVVSGGLTLGDILEEQIRFQAKRRKTTVQEIVDYLFSSKDSETFLLRLQV